MKGETVSVALDLPPLVIDEVLEGHVAHLRAKYATNSPIPAGAMRVAPGTDAVVWRICPDHSGEL